MSDKKYVVTSERVNRVYIKRQVSDISRDDLRRILEAFAADLAENPVVPTDDQIYEMTYGLRGLESFGKVAVRQGSVEWQRRMFLAPEPEVPEEIRDLLCPKPCATRSAMTELAVNESIIEAYKRGKCGK